jgi:alpha-glucosidase
MQGKAWIVLIASLVFVLLMIAPSSSFGSEPLSVASPDGNIKVEVELKANPQPYLPGERAYYRVSYKGAQVLKDSPLGLDFVGSRPMDRDFEISGSDRQSHRDSWENAFDVKRRIPDNYNQLTISLKERQAPNRRIDLILRVFNEGLAFRYFLPQQAALGKFVLAAENTGFYFVPDSSAFALNQGKFNTSNEGEFQHISLSEIKPSSIINLPLLVEIPGGPWVGLLEADLTDYSGMYVGGVAGVENALLSKLSPTRDRMDQVVIGSTPKSTPWRVLLINSRPGALIESNYIVLDLSAPCALADTSWIQPGKSAWDWWSGSFAKNVDFKPGMNTATMKHYIDFAAEHHLEYMLVDAGWYPAQDYTHALDILHHVPEVDVPDIIAYAKQKGVKTLLWLALSVISSFKKNATWDNGNPVTRAKTSTKNA